MTTRTRIEWRVPAYLPHVQPTLTAAAVEDAERRLGLRLPEAYLEALREQNGGALRHPIRGFEIASEVWGIGPRFPSILRGTLAIHEGEGWLPDGAAGLVPMAGDGHWYLCFDVRDGRAEPAITYVDLECMTQQPVAETFAALIGMQAPVPEDRVIGLSTPLGLEEAAQRLAKVLRVKLEDQGADHHGYRTFHGRAKGRTAVAQFWLCPNQAPRGFVRDDHPEHAALAALLPGTALRVPEHPDCPLLLTAAELDDATLLDACARAELPARRLVLT